MRKVSPGQRARLRARSGDCCEICGQPANNAHHRKNASQGGTDDLSNLLMLCGSGTTGCHGYVTEHPAVSRQRGWSMWRSDTPSEVPVYYRGYWVLLSDDEEVQLIRREEVRIELGHLHAHVH